MKRLRNACVIGAFVCGLALLVWPLGGCGGGGGDTPNHWDVMVWDTGVWQ
jgi:hypothetical protein